VLVAGAAIVPVAPLTPAGAAGSYGVTIFQGTVGSSPDAALAPGDTKASMVIRGTDGFIYFAHLDAFWNGWESLGAPPVGAVGDPAVVSWAPGRVDVFVRGGDNRLWQTYRPTPTSFFSPWIKPVGDFGFLGSGPEVSSRGPGLLDLFTL